MKLAEIYAVLDEIAPFGLAQDWDNVGLLVGQMSSEVEHVVCVLDVDSSLVEKAAPNTLFVSHHPLIFRGLKRLCTDAFPANVLAELLRKNCSLVAMHTNADVAFLNRFVLREILGFGEFCVSKKSEFLLEFDVNLPFDEFAFFVKERLGLKWLNGVKSGDWVGRAALCTGSGAEFLSQMDAECLLTGDLKYHAGVEAKENGKSIIDITHFHSEIWFEKALVGELKSRGVVAKEGGFVSPFVVL